MIQKEELEHMYCDKGMSMKEIGHEAGITYNTVWDWMKKYEIERRSISESLLLKSSIKMPSKEELEIMYMDKKMSTPEIAREIGVTQKTVWNWMQKLGIELRTKSEAHINGDFFGERARNWKNGLSFIPYCQKFNNPFKEAVRLRDDYTCQLCGYEQKLDGQKLDVHHIHYDKENCWPDVVTLCHSCNAKVNGNRDGWEKYFEDDLSIRGLINWRLES